MSIFDEIWLFDGKSFAIKPIAFLTWFITFRTRLKIGAKSAFSSQYLGYYLSDRAEICHLRLF